jgi:hypothetical protein
MDYDNIDIFMGSMWALFDFVEKEDLGVSMAFDKFVV